ncbi:MAG TPA: A24 family peptidase [Ruania sp.]|nr:A24 family peptidase [Ruania sp.]
MPSALPASLPLALVCAAAATLLAWAGTPTLDRLIGRRTAWTARGTHLVLAALGGLAAGLRGHGPGEVLALVGTAVGLALLVTADLAVHRLPDRLTLPTALWVGGCWLVLCLSGAPWAGLGRALLAGAALGVGFLLLCLLTPGGIGLGDAKLAAVLGLVLGWFGWAEVLAAVVGAFLLGGLFATGLLLARRATRRTAVAFGPWLVAGAVLALGWAPVLVG